MLLNTTFLCYYLLFLFGSQLMNESIGKKKVETKNNRKLTMNTLLNTPA